MINTNGLEYAKLEYYLSQPRLQRFLRASGNSKERAKSLYKANLRVSQAFYPILNLFEVFLRNTLDHHISSHFSNPNWIITEKSGFMSDPSLAGSRYFLRESIQKAEDTIHRKGGSISAGKVIAEQSFGFWTSLFETHHYRLIGGSPIHSFPYKPAHVNRNAINQHLDRLRKFRNRIYHNEPICFNGLSIDFSKAQENHNQICLLLEWIDPSLTAYVQNFDGIQSEIENAQII